MNNMGAIISGHNAKILSTNKKSDAPSGCNCRKPQECPMPGNCLVTSCVYKASISTPSLPAKHYYGMTEGTFKTRYTLHKSSFMHHQKRHTTVLSQYYWELRDKDIKADEIKIHWSVAQKAHPYKCGTRRCDICLSESTVIALAEKATLLNKRSELVSACPHMAKYRLNQIEKRKKKH